MGHTDTVQGGRDEMGTFRPSARARDGGFIYGRGTLDDKDNLTAGMMTHAAAQAHRRSRSIAM